MRGIYFVGGASASGKSTATRQLARDYAVPRIELDELFNKLDFVQDNVLQTKIMKAATESLLRQLIRSGADMIVEGGWMWPDVAERLLAESNHPFCAVYCGYPNASAESRLAMIRTQEGERHWLADKPEAEALKRILQQIEGSGEYRKAAEHAGFLFFDFTDISSGNENLIDHYREWRAQPDAA